jgi:hypothetical protein
MMTREFLPHTATNIFSNEENRLRPKTFWRQFIRTEFSLLSIYKKPRLTLKEACQAIGMSITTVYNQRAAHTFPIPMSRDTLHVDIRDATAYLDKLRAQAEVIHFGRTTVNLLVFRQSFFEDEHVFQNLYGV